ncbi:hypothetical protein [Streptomyces sp. NPDC001594]|uniref:hypothetical protein n=1 Tax=Streptomyces sp. NPDC001594 TaxID=3364590 RepID=UPI0036B44316
MSLDAMDWVWNHSSSRGLARMALLAIADKCPDAKCTAYAGTTMLLQRTNATRSGLRAAIDNLIKMGELAIKEEAKGPRGETVYQLPLAVDHVRGQKQGACEKPGPLTDPGRQEASRGSVSGPVGDLSQARRGPVTGPQNARNQKQHKEQQPRATSIRSMTSEPVRQLALAMKAEGLPVHWNLSPSEQHDLEDLIQHHGTHALVEVVARRTAPGDAPKSARYWLRAWADLDQRTFPPNLTTNVVPLTQPTHSGHTAALMGGLALLTQDGGV